MEAAVSKAQILIVEDDPDICELLAYKIGRASCWERV